MVSLRRIALLVLALALGAGCRFSDPEAAAEHERVAAQHMQAGRFDEALRELEAALREEPRSVKAAISLATLYERGGDPLLAVHTLERLLEEVPTAYLARMSLARIYVNLGRTDKALEQYAIVGQAANNSAAYLAMADVYERRRQRPEAERATLAAIQAEPTSPAARYRLARLYDAARVPAARDAWDRYVASATGIDGEAERLAEARARLLALTPALPAPERRALFRSVRERLVVAPPSFHGALSAEEAQPIALDPGPAELRRIYPGRTHVTLYLAGTEPVRGSGAGGKLHDATLYEGITAAVDDVRRSRVYDLYYATAQGRTRIEVDLEAGPPEPLALEDRDGAVTTTAATAPLGPDDAVEARLEQRAALILPSDRVRRGLRTTHDVALAAARDLALAPFDWARAAYRRIPMRGYVEGADGGPPAAEPAALESGAPAPREPTREGALSAVRAGATWILEGLTPSGALGDRYDPADGGRFVTATARAQTLAVAALRDAGRALGEPRFADAAQVVARGFAERPPEAIPPAPGPTTPTAGPTASPRALDPRAEARELLRLAVDARAGHLYPEPARALGGFRTHPFDRRIDLEATTRAVSALARLAPSLPREPQIPPERR